MDNILVVKETTLTIEKKPLVLVVPYLPSISLEARTKLKKSLKSIFKYCKVQILFKNRTILGNNFYFKNRIPNNLTSGVAYNLPSGVAGLCNESYYVSVECVKHLNVRVGKHIDISPLTKKQVKPKNRSVANHFLFCNHSESYDDFTILTRENKKVLLEAKESVLIMRD